MEKVNGLKARKLEELIRMRIKNWLHEPFAGDTPTTDVHATDPARLKKEIEQDMGIHSSDEKDHFRRKV